MKAVVGNSKPYNLVKKSRFKLIMKVAEVLSVKCTARVFVTLEKIEKYVRVSVYTIKKWIF